MFICEDCHTKRQDDLEVESQEIQWTGRVNGTIKKCIQCGWNKRGRKYEYLNAFELCQELDELKTKLSNITDNRSGFLLSLYAMDAVDMVNRINHFPAILNDPEAMRAVIKYSADLEEVLND